MSRVVKVLFGLARTYRDIEVNLNSARVKLDILKFTVEVITYQSVNKE